MKKIDKAMEMIAEWEYDQRHVLELESLDKALTLRELVIEKYCPKNFGMECDCRFLECMDCWNVEEGDT